jgi:hypothetical protein
VLRRLATDVLPQLVVGEPERLGDGHLRIDLLQLPLVRDRDQRIDRIAQVGDALLGGAPAVWLRRRGPAALHQ